MYIIPGVGTGHQLQKFIIGVVLQAMNKLAHTRRNADQFKRTPFAEIVVSIHRHPLKQTYVCGSRVIKVEKDIDQNGG